MRIALLTYATKPRGSVIHTLELATALHQLGVAVTVFALAKEAQGFDFPLPCPVELIPAAPAPSHDMAALIAQRSQELCDYLAPRLADYSGFHAQDCLSANALAQLPIPGFIRTVHHIEDFQDPYLRACQDRSIREAIACVCVSETWQTALSRDYGLAAHLIRNGVNLERFTPVGPALPRLGEPYLLSIGGIEPRKNSLTTLRAFALLRQRYPKAHWQIAGGATFFDHQDYRQQFWQTVTDLDLSDNVSHLGVVSYAELPSLYRSADVFVFPSLREGWGLVVLEALATGVPVVTARQPPFTEFLSDASAVLVDPRDPVVIANGIETAWQSAPQRQAAGSAVAQRYTWANAAAAHHDLYRRIYA